MLSTPDPNSLESDRPRSLSEPRISTPTLVVMLGSTSALAGLELMRHMLTLKASDLRRVALVYIDTDDQPSQLVEFRKQHKAMSFQEILLRIAVPTGLSYVTRIPQSSEEKGKDPRDLKEQHTFIRDKEPQYFSNGAGGIRNNGHVAASFGHHLIYNNLDQALSRIEHLGSEQGESRIREVQANIVAFLGGGTGSGILPDIAVMIRQLLANRQYKQRINLFCMLPEPIRGVSVTDLSWRRSNAAACLLELLAYSRAAAGDGRGYYEKYMRGTVYRLTNDAIANEIYLVGHSAMGDAGDSARIVGIDLFQRICDASGVGFLEHSKWVDRRTLGGTDDKGLPTMFGTSCPLEVRFPADETATAFAQISAAQLLPLLASHRPVTYRAGDKEKSDWVRKWRNVARFDANVSDPLAVKLPEFRQSEFEEANAAQLDTLWNRMDKHDRALEARIREIIDAKSQEEVRRISANPRSDDDGDSVINRQIRYLQRLQQEYQTALDDLAEKEAPFVPRRPTDLEGRLIGQMRILQRFRGYAGAVCEAYNKRVRASARAIRYRLLEHLLKILIQHVQEALDNAQAWFQSTEAEERAKELENQGMASMAWQGRLEYAHPHQRHIFDLRSLRAQDGRSVAAERLYRWATGGDTALADETPLEFTGFVNRYFEYLSRGSTSGSDGLDVADRLQEKNASRLADRVMEFFRDYYLGRFQDTNLFELLDKAAPPPQKGQSRARQISGYLLEHLRHMRGLMAGLIAFEAELWHEGLASLDTSVYLGIHWRDGSQKAILDQTLDDLGPLTERGQTPMIDPAIDPHRLQVAYGQHAISLTTVKDFYLEQNSSMEAYLFHQSEWDTSYSGGMPVHSSGEAERLVTQKDALKYGIPLFKRVTRQPFSHSQPAAPGGSPSGDGHL
jgi:hypothetical protein